MADKNYDRTIMRIAGNLLSGSLHVYNFNEHGVDHMKAVKGAVRMARAIVAEVQRTAVATDAESTRVGSPQ